MDLLRDNPALSDPGWLPEGLSEEMDELRREHIELLDQWGTAGSEHTALKKSYEAEDEARVAAYRAGEEVPEITPKEKREAALSDAEARTDGLSKTVTDFLEKAVETIQEGENDLLFRVAVQEREAAEKRAEASRMLDEADEQVRRVAPYRIWMKRTVRNTPGRHIAINGLAAAQPERQVDLAHVLGHSPELEEEEARV